MNDTLRISVVFAERADYVDNEALVAALRPHLHWITISREAYRAFHEVAPKGCRILIDHYEQPHGETLSIDQALAMFEAQSVRNEEERRARAPAAGSAKAKKKVKKGLTPRQQRELEELRAELGQEKGNG